MELEINRKFVKANTEPVSGKVVVSITPPLDEDYWVLRVKVSKTQAVVGFPKFFTIGIGFQKEEDWNTNLPYTVDAERIYNHIKHNKGDSKIKKQNVIKAIQMIQAKVTELGVQYFN